MEVVYTINCPACKTPLILAGGTPERLEARCPVCRHHFVIYAPIIREVTNEVAKVAS